jgi:hypothetical protein
MYQEEKTTGNNELMEVEAEGHPSKTLKEFEISGENCRQLQRITEDFVEKRLINIKAWA